MVLSLLFHSQLAPEIDINPNNQQSLTSLRSSVENHLGFSFQSKSFQTIIAIRQTTEISARWVTLRYRSWKVPHQIPRPDAEVIFSISPEMFERNCHSNRLHDNNTAEETNQQAIRRWIEWNPAECHSKAILWTFRSWKLLPSVWPGLSLSEWWFRVADWGTLWEACYWNHFGASIRWKTR